MTKKKIIIISIIILVVLIAVISLAVYFSMTVGKVDGNEGYYVLCYFTGNSPDQERVCLAISNDGYNFKEINNGKPVIEQHLGTGCCRDPFLFKANDKYYIIATDMKSDLGWNSNYSMVMWESEDLKSWTNERIFNIRLKEGYENSCRVWAPQVIYDVKRHKYMVYWSNCIETDWNTHLVYAYLNDDFSDIGEVNTLYKPDSGKEVIDGDIIYEGGVYYLYYKDEKESKICYVYSKNLTGPYIEPENPKVSKSSKDVEGSCMYRLKGTDTYLMIMDEYSNHHYFMQATTASSMTEFKKVRGFEFSFPSSIRHASVLEVGEEAYKILENWN